MRAGSVIYKMLKIVVALTIVEISFADIYLHNPRGSNNRWAEDTRARKNANRLFDSQNNNRGGYNVGSTYYNVGSTLPIEWTNQHSCGAENSHCEIILQYMCSDTLRDGTTTKTIPDEPRLCKRMNCDLDLEYGMHENWDYYSQCRRRERNKGLFTADQKLGYRRRYAANTRQNPAGTRQGYECPEERDYYPYWHPSPWKDIAVMTNEATRCAFYQTHSENVMTRWACVIDVSGLRHDDVDIPNNKEECEALQGDASGVWTEFPSHKIPAPACHESLWSRDNHNGNGIGGFPNGFNWTIPDDVSENCAVRIRYNISTDDYAPWNTFAAPNSPSPADVQLGQAFNFTQNEALERGYEFKENPQVEVFPGIPLQLAIDTAQLGRTFQDRSHHFAIRSRLRDVPQTATVHNVQVRGKRGNIVQVYPAVEYDFVPNTLVVQQGDYVHFQWTGSNSNPPNNDGQGRAGTDRSNVVLQAGNIYPETSMRNYTFGNWGRSYPETLPSTTFLGMNRTDLYRLALLNGPQLGGNMAELDDGPTYFDLGPRKVTETGTVHYMCTRNNNFSNRSQKGRIICVNDAAQTAAIGWNGGTVHTRSATISVVRGAFTRLWHLTVEEWEEEEAQAAAQRQGASLKLGDGFWSRFIRIHPEEKLALGDQSFTVQLKLRIVCSLTQDIYIYHAFSDAWAWSRVPGATIQCGTTPTATFSARYGGVYVAVGHRNEGLVLGCVLGAVVLLVGLTVAVAYCVRHPGTLDSVAKSFQRNKV